jgi:hypothetical protein
MASKGKGGAAPAAAVTTITTPAPTPIALDLTRHATVTLLPLDVRRRAMQLTADAESITAIGSPQALETADLLACGAKALESEIEETYKAQLKPVEDLLAAAKAEIKAVLMPLATARQKLAETVVTAKGALGYTGGTHCYSADRPTLKIVEAAKIPRTVVIPAKDGKPAETVELFKLDEAAVNRAIKAGVHVPGIYQGTETTYATRAK